MARVVGVVAAALLLLLPRGAWALRAPPATRLRAPPRPATTTPQKLEETLVATPTVAYDPSAAEALLKTAPARWLRRNAELFFPLAAFVGKVAVDRALGREPRLRATRAAELGRVLENLGPAIIKAGQALGSRPDLVPAEYLAALQRLQDRCAPFPTDEALRRVEASLGLAFDDVFALEHGGAPVAAASIGQVYRARLRKDDALVALKVQRPNCEEIIGLDLYILRWWASRATTTLRQLFGRNIDLVSVVDDFGRLIYAEIDYTAEARNAANFAAAYDGDEIRVPRVYDELTTATVLTMEWVEGTRLVDGDALVALTGDAAAPGRLVDALVQCSLKQMLESGFFHADPHAGNLLATADGKLCYLDFGMMSYLEESQRLAIIEAVVHLVNRDFDALAELYGRMGFIAAGTDVAPIVEGLTAALPDVLDAPVSELNVKNVASKLGDVMCRSPVSLNALLPERGRPRGS